MTDKYYVKYLKYKQLYLDEKDKLNNNMKGGTMPGLSKQLEDNSNFFKLNKQNLIKSSADEMNKFIKAKVVYDKIYQFFQNLNSTDTHIFDSNSFYFLISKFYPQYFNDNLQKFIEDFINKCIKQQNQIYFCFDKLDNNQLIKTNEQIFYRDYSTILDNNIIENIFARKIIPNIMTDYINTIKTTNTNVHLINDKDGEADNFIFDYVQNDTKSYLITQDGDIVISLLLRGTENKKLFENIQVLLWRYTPNINFDCITSTEYIDTTKSDLRFKKIESTEKIIYRS